jgi:uncharacterized protein YndB with AHSA1/START domain
MGAMTDRVGAEPGELRLTVAVAAPAATTWAAVTDWDRQREWMLGTRVRSTSHGGRGVGAGLRAVTGIGRFGFADSMVVTEWVPPRLCRVRHTGRVVRGTGAFEVTDRPGGSTFVWSERLELPFGPVGWRLLSPLARWGLRRSLRRFAGWVERYEPAAGGADSS